MSLPQDIQCFLKKDSRFIGTQFELRRYAEIAMSLKRKQLVR